MKKLILTITFILGALSPAIAQDTFVTDDGYISMTGRIDFVSTDSFDMIVNDDERVEVSVDSINEATLDRLIDTDILEADKYVTVRGELEDGISGPVIKAETINVHSNEYNQYYEDDTL
jgi:hypothetical protein